MTFLLSESRITVGLVFDVLGRPSSLYSGNRPKCGEAGNDSFSWRGVTPCNAGISPRVTTGDTGPWCHALEYRLITAIIAHLSEATIGHHEEACKKKKGWRWQEVRGSKAAAGIGETQLARGISLGWGFSRVRRNPERSSQSALWQVRPLGLDGGLGAHCICFDHPISSPALGVIEAEVSDANPVKLCEQIIRLSDVVDQVAVRTGSLRH